MTEKIPVVKIPTESAEQIALVRWFRSQYPSVVIFAIPNGGYRHAKTAQTLKAEGVAPGVPDLYIPAWHLWIEMKRAKGGRLSADQKTMIEYLRRCGDTVEVCAGAAEAVEVIKKFISP